MASQTGTSRLAQMQMRFQQKQQEERAQRKLEMTGPRNESGDGNSLNSSIGPGKVRQMFDERRQRTTGIDKSYPLKPIAPRSSPASTIATKATTVVKKQTSIKQINGRVTSTNNETRETRETIIRNGEDVFNNSLNGNTIISNKHYLENEDSIDNGNYQDIRSELDSEILGLTISEKLPNLGKLNSDNSRTKNGVIDDRTNNNNNFNENRSSSSNSIKLKPVIMKKTPVISDTTLKNTRGTTNRARNSPSPPKISSPISHKSITTAPLKKTIAKAPSNSNASSVKKTPNSTPRRMASASKPQGPVSAPPENMAACRRCGRHFNVDRIEKHEQICEKTAAKKRKIFDAAKHRVQGTEAERYVRKVSSRTSNARTAKPAAVAATSDPVKKSNWRQKHEEFIQAIRAAKEMKAYLARGGKLADLPPPPPSENPDYVQCPHCSRRFNRSAAERHIPKCATMLHNKPKPGAAPKKKR